MTRRGSSWAATRAPGWWNAAIPFAGRLLAEYASGTPAPVYFDHPNILGSEQQWTDCGGEPRR